MNDQIFRVNRLGTSTRTAGDETTISLAIRPGAAQPYGHRMYVHLDSADEIRWLRDYLNTVLEDEDEAPCEVNDCDRPAEPCECGNAHCATHPHED